MTDRNLDFMLLHLEAFFSSPLVGGHPEPVLGLVAKRVWLGNSIPKKKKKLLGGFLLKSEFAAIDRLRNVRRNFQISLADVNVTKWRNLIVEAFWITGVNRAGWKTMMHRVKLKTTSKMTNIA